MEQLTLRITDSGTVSVAEGEVIRRPLAQADGTNRSVRRLLRETRRSLPKANGGVVFHDPIGSKTTALIRGGGCREYNQLKSNGGA